MNTCPLNITINRRITPAWHLAACWTAAVTISRALPGGSTLAMLTWSRWNLPTEEQAAVELEKLTQMAEQHAEQAGYEIVGRLGVPCILQDTAPAPEPEQPTRFPRAQEPVRPHLWAKVHGPEHTGVECFYCRQRASRPQPGACPGRAGGEP